MTTDLLTIVFINKNPTKRLKLFKKNQHDTPKIKTNLTTPHNDNILHAIQLVQRDIEIDIYILKLEKFNLPSVKRFKKNMEKL